MLSIAVSPLRLSLIYILTEFSGASNVTRIGSNGLTGIDKLLQFNLQKSFNKQNQAATRLATLQRINQAKDDPSGLIAVESLRAELVALEAADRSASRAGAALAVADSGLSQVSDRLIEIQGLLVESAGGSLSDAQLAANQAQIDANIEAINRVGNTTSFNGQNLLDGESFSFILSANPSDIVTFQSANIDSANLGSEGGRLSDLASGGSASLASGNFTAAADILDEVRSQVVTARASAGSFEKTIIGSAQEISRAAQVNISSAISEIADADVAIESARLVQSQILVQAGLKTLEVGSFNRSLITSLFDTL